MVGLVHIHLPVIYYSSCASPAVGHATLSLIKDRRHRGIHFVAFVNDRAPVIFHDKLNPFVSCTRVRAMDSSARRLGSAEISIIREQPVNCGRCRTLMPTLSANCCELDSAPLTLQAALTVSVMRWLQLPFDDGLATRVQLPIKDH